MEGGHRIFDEPNIMRQPSSDKDQRTRMRATSSERFNEMAAIGHRDIKRLRSTNAE